MIEFLGWAGSVAFAICGFPLAYEVFKKKCADHVNSQTLFLWVFGEIATLVYVSANGDYPLILNYACNATALSVIVYFKLLKYFKKSAITAI